MAKILARMNFFIDMDLNLKQETEKRYVSQGNIWSNSESFCGKSYHQSSHDEWCQRCSSIDLQMDTTDCKQPKPHFASLSTSHFPSRTIPHLLLFLDHVESHLDQAELPLEGTTRNHKLLKTTWTIKPITKITCYIAIGIHLGLRSLKTNWKPPNLKYKRVINQPWKEYNKTWTKKTNLKENSIQPFQNQKAKSNTTNSNKS